ENALELEPAEGPQRVRDVANRLLAKNFERRRLLRPKLIEAAKKIPCDPPALKLLAEISAFKLFVAVTPDGCLELALNRARYNGRRESVALTNAPEIEPHDLGGDLHGFTGTAVFYPFGRYEEGKFAITEEETLEYLFHLLSRTARFDNLFAGFQNAHLLFL